MDPPQPWVFELLLIVVFKLTEDFGKQRSPDESIHALKFKIKIHSNVAVLKKNICTIVLFVKPKRGKTENANVVSIISKDYELLNLFSF